MGVPRQTVLVYDQIRDNQRHAVFLLASFALISLPVILYVVGLITALAGSLICAFGEQGPHAMQCAMSIFPLGLFVALFLLYLAYRGAASHIVPATGAVQISQVTEPELHRIVENLCIGAGLPRPELYLIEDDIPNAFAAGLDPARSYLVVTRGLLEKLDYREIEGVIAHELVQIANNDVRLGTLLAACTQVIEIPGRLLKHVFSGLNAGSGCLVGCVTLLAMTMLWTLIYFAFVSAAETSSWFWSLSMQDATIIEMTVGIFGIVLAPLYGFIVGPFAAKIVRGTLGHRREFLADSQAVLLARYPDGLAHALIKINEHPGSWGLVSREIEHLLFVGPSSTAADWSFLVPPSHPSVSQRLAELSRVGTSEEHGNLGESVRWAHFLGPAVVPVAFVLFAFMTVGAARNYVLDSSARDPGARAPIGVLDPATGRYVRPVMEWASPGQTADGRPAIRRPAVGQATLVPADLTFRQRVFLVDPSTSRTAGQVAVGGMVRAAVATSGSSVYVLHGADALSVQTPAGSRVIVQGLPGQLPRDLVVAPGENRAYVASGDLLTVVELPRGETSRIVRADARINRLVGAADGDTLYLITASGISTFNTSTHRLTPSSGGSGVRDALVDAPGDRVFSIEGDRVGYRYLASTESTSAPPVPVQVRSPSQLALSPDESLLYVSTAAGVTVLDAETLTTQATIPIRFGDFSTASGPRSLSLHAEGARLCVARQSKDWLATGQAKVWIIDTESNQILDELDGQGLPLCVG
jgi:heat shock protein HtpX